MGEAASVLPLLVGFAALLLGLGLGAYLGHFYSQRLARVQLEAERAAAAEKLALLEQARATLYDQFKNLANEILEDKSKRFTQQNQLNLEQMLTPLQQQIREFKGKVEEVYVQEGKDRSALAQQVRQLMALNQQVSEDAKSLTSALKGSNKTQGNWGELVLVRVLEASGLRKGEEYVVQESHAQGDGRRLQPDVIIRLPEQRCLVVDSKVSLTAYEAAASAETDHARDFAVKTHLQSIRAHMKGLSEKNYQSLHGVSGLDFVLMFIPVEPAFMMAVSHDKELFMDAWQKNVLLVSPSTLLFVVRTVAHLWRQEAQTENAQLIAKQGAELYDKFVGLVGDLQGLGERLRQANDEYQDAMGKLSTGKGNLIRRAERLKTLGVMPSKALPGALLKKSEPDED